MNFYSNYDNIIIKEVVTIKPENTAIRLKHIMDLKGYKQVDILNLCKPYCEKYNVKMNKSDLSQYVSGKVEPNQDKLFVLGNALNVSEAWLMGYDVPMEREQPIVRNSSIFDIPGIIPLPKTYMVPLLGEIACGDPILAEQNIIDSVPVPEYIKGANFALTCKGDSMINARIHDGDIVYIRQQPEVENGQIAAVLIDNEATLKRIYLYTDKLVLTPENPAYPPMIFTGSELEQIRILGWAVGFTSKIK